jgi:hypothetical protein
MPIVHCQLTFKGPRSGNGSDGTKWEFAISAGNTDRSRTTPAESDGEAQIGVDAK